MKKICGLIAMLFLTFCFVGCGSKKTDYVDVGVGIMNLEIGDYTFEVDLEQNKTVKALVELLPLEANMSELNGNEKYCYLETSLPTNTQKVKQIYIGDIMLWKDNCLVIFYANFQTSYAYTKIGHIKDTTNLQAAVGVGSVHVKWSV